MLKIGLTGGIGSGKSTVSAYLKDIGFKIIDADIVAREVLDIYPEVYEYIKNEFGPDFFDAEGKLDRKKLGNFLFANRKELEKYEAIIMPLIKKEILTRMEQFEKNGEKICFLDAPTLIEQGMHKEVDKVILVWVDRETQIKRMSSRDNLEYSQIIDRINCQMNLDEKRKFADYVIDNSDGFENTKKQLAKILAELETIIRNNQRSSLI